MKRFTYFALALGPVAAAALALWPGLGAWFVADDFYHLAYFRFTPRPWASWLYPPFGALAFRPATFTIGFGLDRLFGRLPLAVHTVDLAIHSLNVMLVFGFSFCFFRRREEIPGPGPAPLAPALAAALLFAVHPVAALSAAWLACRADLLASFFSFLTLFLIVIFRRPSPATFLLTLVLSLLAMLCKETHYPLFILVFFLAWSLDPGPRRPRLGRAAGFALPVFLALGIGVTWRLAVLRAVGAYGAVPSSWSAFLSQAAYHLPKVYAAAARDFAQHHLGRDGYLVWPLLAAGIALLVCGGWGAWQRRRPELGFALLVILVGLLPAWNLSYMFAAREERLLYFPLLGFVLIAAGLVSGPRSRVWQGAALGAIFFAALTFGLYSRERVEDWKLLAGQNLSRAKALAAYVQSPAGGAGLQRLYLLAGGHDDYYLDAMVKTLLPAPFLNREILPGDRPGFVWESRQSKTDRGLPRGPAEAFPAYTDHATFPGMSLQTADPPDLLEASAEDPAARILEWDGHNLHDLTRQLRALYHRRLALQQQTRIRPAELPSFSFRESRIPFDWELSPGLGFVEPLAVGVPFTLIAQTRDPYLISPPLTFPALAASELDIEMELPRRGYLPPGEDQACVMWQSKDRPFFTPERTICFPLRADGQVHSYRVNLQDNVHWARSGLVTRLRLDPLAYPAVFDILSMEFFTP